MGLIFTHPNDNRLEDASSITLAAGTVLSGSALANLYDPNPANALMLSDTTLDLRIDFGSAVSIPFATYIHSNSDVAAAIQTDSTNDFSTPDDSDTFAIPTVSNAGFYSAPFLDLRSFAAARWWRFLITANTLPVTVGTLWLGSAYRTLAARNFKYAGLRQQADGSTNIITTATGVDLAYSREPRRDSWSGVVLATAPDLALIEAWLDAARFAARPFVFVPDAQVNAAYMARFDAATSPRAPLGPSLHDIAMTIRQVSYGLPWIDPDA